MPLFIYMYICIYMCIHKMALEMNANCWRKLFNIQVCFCFLHMIYLYVYVYMYVYICMYEYVFPTKMASYIYCIYRLNKDYGHNVSDLYIIYLYVHGCVYINVYIC
jgi:hypothetical protein